jgi:DNA-binding beta-propeller fold protein YncE
MNIMDRNRIIRFVFIIISIFVIGIIVYRVISPAAHSDAVVFSSFWQDLPYDLTLPDKTITLSSKLKEISGISFYNNTTIACCEDENGKVYLVDLKTEEITGSYKFSKDADYEDIEVVEDLVEDMVTKIYVLKSSGNIYRIKRLGLEDQKVKRYKTFLTRESDAEGLCYDKKRNALLVACKGSIRLGTKRAIYVFDLNTKQMQRKPLFVFDYKSAEAGDENRIHMYAQFQPSGISVHPITGEIYIISSVGKLLLVINNEGEILSITPLPKNIFRQPEGICFFPNGDLYISNEGKGGKGNILLFTYNK